MNKRKNRQEQKKILLKIISMRMKIYRKSDEMQEIQKDKGRDREREREMGVHMSESREISQTLF